jgi:3-phosphoshikimate 1-carboxyvinyltransferase
VPALRYKESDRIAALARALSAAGARCRELADGLLVDGPLRAPGGGPLHLPAPADHRVVMALAILGTLHPGGVVVDHPGAVAKSWPGYFEWLGRVARVESR